jgi:hypothetical protein
VKEIKRESRRERKGGRERERESTRRHPPPRAPRAFTVSQAVSPHHSGDTTPCKVIPVILHWVVSGETISCRMTRVTLHGVVFPKPRGGGELTTLQASEDVSSKNAINISVREGLSLVDTFISLKTNETLNIISQLAMMLRRRFSMQ